MSRRANFTPEARADIKYYARYLGERVDGLDVTFNRSIRSTADRLAEMPGLGSPYESDHPNLSVLRVQPVTGFPNHLIFYHEWGRSMRVVAVLHGARNLDALLVHRFET
jgi:plasmid stabilization system protein ParE